MTRPTFDDDGAEYECGNPQTREDAEAHADRLNAASFKRYEARERADGTWSVWKVRHDAR